MADEETIQGEEFDCLECGRLIVRLVPDGTGKLCGLCLMMPGWFKVPEVRAILDPDHDGRDRSDPLDVPPAHPSR